MFVSTPGTFLRFGWPLSGESGAMNVDNSDSGKKPLWARVAYKAAAQCPLLKMKRSRSGSRGFSGSTASTPPNRVARMSVTDRSPPM